MQVLFSAAKYNFCNFVSLLYVKLKEKSDSLKHISFKKQLQCKNQRVRDVREMLSAATIDLIRHKRKTQDLQ